ncbi:hypothetical protein [Marisediminicola senii]|uniref:hypothetical protein n=1 Tax=Marisediminicola senii TaxID=2711233 RepID=UPI0013EAE189|nr:hypothetical protein [Marisediminicola senii]
MPAPEGEQTLPESWRPFFYILGGAFALAGSVVMILVAASTEPASSRGVGLSFELLVVGVGSIGYGIVLGLRRLLSRRTKRWPEGGLM